MTSPDMMILLGGFFSVCYRAADACRALVHSTVDICTACYMAVQAMRLRAHLS